MAQPAGVAWRWFHVAQVDPFDFYRINWLVFTPVCMCNHCNPITNAHVKDNGVTSWVYGTYY